MDLADIRAQGRRLADAVPALFALAGSSAAVGSLDPDGLDAVVDPVRASGVPVTVVMEGRPRGTGSEVDLFAARIVTEALTNVLRHAGPTPTAVDVVHGESDVVVTVTDGGPAPDHRPGSAGGGRGLVGMRERAELVGGELEAGPAGTGWRVRARLPVVAE